MRHARRQDSRSTNSADHNALEAKLMLADATIMRYSIIAVSLCVIVMASNFFFFFAHSMRAEMKRDVLQLDTEKVKKLRLLGSGSFADVHESLLEV